MSSPYGERIVRLEERVRHLQEDVNQLSSQMDRISNKLDELLQLKHKGAGALWLVSAVAAIAFAEALRLGFNYFFRR